MKKFFYLFSFLFIFSFPCFAQIDDGWVEVGNAAYNSDLWSATFISNDVGFAVGNGGAFLKTTNGGLTWTAYNTGYGYFFEKVIFTSSTVGYLIGNKYQGFKGRVLKTIDGGNTWTEILIVTIPDCGFLNVAYFTDDNHGWLGGEHYNFVTTNGGATWTEILTNANVVRGMYFKNNLEGFYTTGYNIYKTIDGGMTWTISTYFSEMPKSIYFVDASNGFLSVSIGNILYKTIDGGTTWNPTASTGLMNQSESGIVFTSANTGYVCSNDAGSVSTSGKIARTTDGGATWNIVFSDITYTHRCFAKKPDNELFCFGRGGSILKSTNGTNWVTVQRGVLFDRLYDICFLNDSTAFAVGGSGIIAKTTNKCASWTIINSGTTKKLLNITSTDPTTLYITGVDSLLLKSTDGGLNWLPSNSGYNTSFRVSAPISFLNSTTGFACGTNIHKTTNAGASWTVVQASPGTSELEAGDNDTLFAAEWGYYTKLYRSIDAGNSWSIIYEYSTESIRALDFLTAKKGMMTIRNFVKTTVDAGNTWSTVTIPDSEVTNLFSDIEMKSDLEATVVGYYGKIYNTGDAGTSWTEVQSNTQRRMFKLKYGPDGTGYILAEDAQILRQADEQTYSLTFSVTNTSGNPVNEAIITLNGFTYPAGMYQMEGLLPGVYNWSVDCAGYCTQNGITNITGDTEEAIVLGNCFDALIVVENIFNQPVQGATVTLAGQSQTTNAVGLAAFNVLQGTSLSLNITAGGYLAHSSIIGIISDTTITVVLNADLENPVALEATDTGYFQFRANWVKPVEADSCLLFVSADDFATFVHGFNGKAYAGNNAIVTGLDDNTVYKYKLKAKNEFGLSGFSNTEQVTTLIVSANLPTAAQFIVYPNPVKDILNIKLNFSGKAEIDIFDMKGLSVKKQTVSTVNNSDLAVDVKDFAPGIYSIRILLGNHYAKSNFVKQ